MEHAAYQVDILDASGNIIGTKKRLEVDKATDIFHTVYILLITPEGQLVLTRIPKRHDLPNLFAGRLGMPVATIRRHKESTEHAAHRAIARELFIEEAEVQFVGEVMMSFEEGTRFVSVYALIGEPPHVYSKTDIGKLVIMSPRELAKRLHESPQDFSPPLVATWERWQERLPV